MTRLRSRLVPLALVVGLGAAAAAAGVGPAWASGTSARYKALSDRLVAAAQTALDGADYVRARKICESAVAADPSNANAYTVMARAYQEQRDIPRARKFYATALEVDPLDARALAWSGELDLLAADRKSAEEKLARLERICGDCEGTAHLKELIAAAAVAPKAEKAGLDRVSSLGPEAGASGGP